MGGEESKKLSVYLHVARMGVGPNMGSVAGYESATNHWYVIKHGDEGDTISPVFEEAGQLNHPHRALLNTACAAIGSCIYIIGGRDVIDEVRRSGSRDEIRSNKIRCLDTSNPSEGWKTCYTMPVHSSSGKAVPVVDRDGRWLHLFWGRPECWGYAFNLDDETKSYPIPKPDLSKLTASSLPLPVSTHLFPRSWIAAASRYNLLPAPPVGFVGCYTVSDGILYIYNSDAMCLTALDMVPQKQLYSAKLPRTFWFGPEEFVRLIVLASPYKFCVIWEECSGGVNSRYLNYARFSVSAIDSTITLHHTQIFHISCFKVISTLTM